VGQFKTVYVKATIIRPEGRILQTAGRGEIQLAAPIAATTLVAEAKSQPASPPQEKPLRRLDQLRQAKKASEDTNLQ
jgi:hypothetical protein